MKLVVTTLLRTPMSRHETLREPHANHLRVSAISGIIPGGRHRETIILRHSDAIQFVSFRDVSVWYSCTGSDLAESAGIHAPRDGTLLRDVTNDNIAVWGCVRYDGPPMRLQLASTPDTSPENKEKIGCVLVQDLRDVLSNPSQ